MPKTSSREYSKKTIFVSYIIEEKSTIFTTGYFESLTNFKLHCSFNTDEWHDLKGYEKGNGYILLDLKVFEKYQYRLKQGQYSHIIDEDIYDIINDLKKNKISCESIIVEITKRIPLDSRYLIAIVKSPLFEYNVTSSFWAKGLKKAREYFVPTASKLEIPEKYVRYVMSLEEFSQTYGTNFYPRVMKLKDQVLQQSKILRSKDFFNLLDKMKIDIISISIKNGKHNGARCWLHPEDKKGGSLSDYYITLYIDENDPVVQKALNDDQYLGNEGQILCSYFIKFLEKSDAKMYVDELTFMDQDHIKKWMDQHRIT